MLIGFCGTITSNKTIQPSLPYWGLTFTAEEANSTVSMDIDGNAPAISLETSTDNGKTWTPFIVGSTTILLESIGDSICFRAGNNGTGGNGLNTTTANDWGVDYNYFVMTGKIAASGDVSSILDRNGPIYDLTGRDCCIGYLFYRCKSLTTAPKLPAMVLANQCYVGLFSECTSLVDSPELPANVLADECYGEIFNGCTSLTGAPILSATTLAYSCYYAMFYGCTSLAVPPELPATELVEECYYEMFRQCASLSAAPELPATFVPTYSYARMFYHCTSLSAAPELPATTLEFYSYADMFGFCSALTYIKTYLSNWVTNATFSWVTNVNTKGTFECPSSLP